MRMTFLPLGLAALFALSAPAFAGPITETTVAQGTLRGVAAGPLAVFKGVPFAAPPVGNLRWRETQAPASWSGVRLADKFSPACFQKVTRAVPSVSEDCLYLNVWTPAQSRTAKLPVLLWIYGGGFQNGAASNPEYDGEALARKGIIVASFNFRVGALGFLAHPDLTAETPSHSSGNYGMYDAIAALKWVRANIAAFGGDPNAITIAGQSSGAGQVAILDVSPLSRGLYARAIVESGPRIGSGGPSLKEAEAQGVAFAHSLGANSIAMLREMPPEKILDGTKDFRFATIFEPRVQPAATIDLIREGQFNKTPMLAGLTYDEHTGQNPKADKMTARECADHIDQEARDWGPRLRAGYMNPPSANCFDDIRLLGRDRDIGDNVIWSKARLARSSQPIFIYMFNHPQPGPDAARDRSFHGVELPYVFNTLDKVPGGRPFAQTDKDIANKVSSYWVNFVKTGNPNGPGLAKWPSIDPRKPQVMELGDSFTPRSVLEGPKAKVMMEYLAVQGPRSLSEGHLDFSR